MTVDDFDMARGRRVGQEDTPERWRDLADLRDGRREKWMTDRAKHALGTPKLASVFLQEEKGRIDRLRKIKSVLASGKLMGGGPTASSSSTQPDRRGRRRPYPNSSQQNSHHQHINHRRFQHANDASLHGVLPNYPTNPFGNVDKDTLQFPVPIGRKRNSLEEAIRNSRKDVTNPQAALHNNSSDGRSGTVWDDDSRAIQEVVSVLAGRKEGLYGSRSVLRNSEAPSATFNENSSTYSPYREHSSSRDAHSERGLSRHSPESLNRSGGGAEGTQAISSGPSAIDLFDQCGLVPKASVEKEGLVGTSDPIDSSQRPPAISTDPDGRYSAASVADNTLAKHPVAPARVALKPPLVSEAPSQAMNDSRPARHYPRDAGRHEARVARTKRAQPAATHGVKPRPPFAGGSVSTLSRHRQGQQQQGLSSSAKDAVPGPSKPSRSVGRGAPPNAATPAGSPSRRSRAEEPSGTDSHSAAQAESRTRRRWNIGEGTTAAAPLPRAPPRSESSSTSVPVSAPLPSASEQRIASAKERLHKDKDLNALKSEHVEALSILQDISCPSTAAGVGESEFSSEPTATEGNTGGKEATTDPDAVEDARIALLRERKNGSTNTTARSAAVVAGIGDGAGQQGPPVGDRFDELSADLPRIGSKEQAALRTLYRKWWMKIANGGTPPSPCTPVDPVEGGIPPVAQQHLPIQREVTVGAEKGTAESVATTAAAGTSESGRPSFSSVTEPRQNRDPPCPQKDPGSAATVQQPENQEVVATVAEMEKKNEPSSPKCTTGEPVCRADDNVESLAGEKASEPPAGDGGITGCKMPPKAKTDTPTQPVETQADGARATAAAAATRNTPPQSEQEEPQQQGISSDVESVSEDDGLKKEEEEGHRGRIYLPDGRFVATWRHGSEEMADAVATHGNAEKAGGEDGRGEVLDTSETKQQVAADDESLGYADEDFECFED